MPCQPEDRCNPAWATLPGTLHDVVSGSPRQKLGFISVLHWLCETSSLIHSDAGIPGSPVHAGVLMDSRPEWCQHNLLHHNAPQLPHSPELHTAGFGLALKAGPYLWPKHFLHLCLGANHLMISLNWHLILVVIACVASSQHKAGNRNPLHKLPSHFSPNRPKHFPPLNSRGRAQCESVAALFSRPAGHSSLSLNPAGHWAIPALLQHHHLHVRAEEQGLTLVDSRCDQVHVRLGSVSRPGSARLSLRCCFALLPRNLQDCSRANHRATSPSTLKIYMACFPLLKSLLTKLCSKMIHRCYH